MARDKLLSGWSPNSVSQFLAETAAGRGSRDDTSVILSVIGGAFVAAAEAAGASAGAVMRLGSSEAGSGVAGAGSGCNGMFVSPPQLRPFAATSSPSHMCEVIQILK